MIGAGISRPDIRAGSSLAAVAGPGRRTTITVQLWSDVAAPPPPPRSPPAVLPGQMQPAHCKAAAAAAVTAVTTLQVPDIALTAGFGRWRRTRRPRPTSWPAFVDGRPVRVPAAPRHAIITPWLLSQSRARSTDSYSSRGGSGGRPRSLCLAHPPRARLGNPSPGPAWQPCRV